MYVPWLIVDVPKITYVVLQLMISMLQKYTKRLNEMNRICWCSRSHGLHLQHGRRVTAEREESAKKRRTEVQGLKKRKKKGLEMQRTRKKEIVQQVGSRTNNKKERKRKKGEKKIEEENIHDLLGFVVAYKNCWRLRFIIVLIILIMDLLSPYDLFVYKIISLF